MFSEESREPSRNRSFIEGGEGPFDLDAQYCWLHGRLLSSVRVRPVHPGASRPDAREEAGELVAAGSERD